MEHFKDRTDAGRRLAAALAGVDLGQPVVLGLPRGGVPVAAPIAAALGAPLDVLVVRKLGVPGQPEVAMGAIGEQGARVLNDDIVDSVFVSPGELRDIERVERAELDARVARFRGGEPPISLEGRTAVIVDDGVATGATARVAAVVAKARGATRVVLAVPVGASDSIGSLAADPAVDEILCLSVPPGFMAVGMHYLDFAQTTDAQVAELLSAARAGD
ncbi:phosphoribosyltransferase [Agromyces fucosus]|uniref:Phosphoribosyltransferase n=1 Tax=Agromyces fucosus TaxID=41985 RepID=A0A4Q2JJH9_9MICO|nr:phosphoribosyltransferase family protein [Agromyces fucosus]RXZ46679.1 phosphoribosyltransferase [Agromyces fucosus]